MSLLVIGTVALDDIETPTEKREDLVGGSATFFGHAAGPYSSVRLVAIVGEDFPEDEVARLEDGGVDTAGLVRVPGKSFHWSGRYIGDMNARETISTELNVFADYSPEVPEAFRDSRFVFLANGHPEVQAAALDQMTAPEFVLLDTMNLWIETTRAPLDALLRRVDAVVVNDEEARMLTGEHNLILAGRAMLELGPKVVILKKGEHGAMLFAPYHFYSLPAYPVTALVDPTGAGDSFAGGFMGSLAEAGEVTTSALHDAMVNGTVMASFAVESFSVDRLAEISLDDVVGRTTRLIEYTTV